MIGKKRFLDLNTRSRKITRNQEQILKEATNFHSALYSLPQQINDRPNQ